ncbi:MAG: DUF1707 domain-containing protein [Streptosporangiales bacterium]|jgi:hypothetical protein|nr:DUF1707 domain-containing protein [Streptosporangiales bacterium]
MATRYYGKTYGPVPQHVLRVGDAERDAAAADLGDHYVAGRLDLTELHDRLSEVFAARTQGQLGQVMADLPGPARPRWKADDGGDAKLAVPRPREPCEEIPSDRAGRFAALSLLILAMLIWLFTAYLFARHGTYAPAGPWPAGH